MAVRDVLAAAWRRRLPVVLVVVVAAVAALIGAQLAEMRPSKRFPTQARGLVHGPPLFRPRVIRLKPQHCNRHAWQVRTSRSCEKLLRNDQSHAGMDCLSLHSSGRSSDLDSAHMGNVAARKRAELLSKTDG